MNLRFWMSGILMVLCSLSQGLAEEQRIKKETNPSSVTEAWLQPKTQEKEEQRKDKTICQGDWTAKKMPGFQDLIGQKLQTNEAAGNDQEEKKERPVLSKQGKGTLSLSGSIAPSFRFGSEENSYSPSIATKLALEHKTEHTWASCSWGLKDKAGIGAAKNSLSLKKACLGYHLLKEEDQTLDLEVGRKGMAEAFYSPLQFGQTLDGALLSYKQNLDSESKLYVRAGTFLNNRSLESDKKSKAQKKEQEEKKAFSFHYAGEIGLDNIAGTGILAKYALIQWNTKMYPSSLLAAADQGAVQKEADKTCYCNSQLTLGYEFSPEELDKKVQFMVSSLYNHLHGNLTSISSASYPFKGMGAAANLSIGELQQQGDWSVDLGYQYLTPDAVSEEDLAGIGLGRDKNNACFAGFEFEARFLLQDSLELSTSWSIASPLQGSSDQNGSYHLLGTSVTYKF